jgi:hypothetical protein
MIHFMGLSPSTLFHLTEKKLDLKGILSETFKLKYCTETIQLKKPFEIMVPMVSFCDIKISEIVDHIDKYGSYGIGLSKTWAIRQRLNPVYYVNTKSNLSANFIEAVKEMRDNIDLKNINSEFHQFLYAVDLLRNMKCYEGVLDRKGKKDKNYRFADEREWRYVPEMTTDLKPKIKPWTLKHIYLANKNLFDDSLKNERLAFKADDIHYILVAKDSEINEIIKHIEDTKGSRYSMQAIKRLNSRIISVERIRNDF